MRAKEEKFNELKTKIELIQEDKKFLYVKAREETQKCMNQQKRIEELEQQIDETNQKLEESEKQCTQLKLIKLRYETYENEELTGTINTSRRNKSLTLERSGTCKNINALKADSYFCPLTQNKKFEQFISDLFETTKEEERQKQEILNYVTVVESFYTQKLQKIRASYDKKLKLLKQNLGFNSNKATMFIERNELEQIFINSVDDVKKQILKRRMKAEAMLNNKSKPMYMDKKLNDPQDEEAKRFEEAILKLVGFAKNKVKYMDFTQVDKYNLLELFVTNEKTLLYIYRSLFQQDAEKKSDDNPLKEKSLRELKQLKSPRVQKNESYNYFITEPPTNMYESQDQQTLQNSSSIDISQAIEDSQTKDQSILINKNFKSIDRSIDADSNGYLELNNFDQTLDRIEGTQDDQFMKK